MAFAPEAATTSATLLGRLHRDPGDQAAWSAFVDRYGPTIYAWCRRRKLQEADAQDVTQQVLEKVFQNMATFAYDPRQSFRGWLYTLTRHTWSDLARSRTRHGLGSGDSDVREQLHSLEARDDLLERLGEAFDLELWEVAKVRVRLQVEPQTWAAFVLTKIEGKTGEEAAKQLGMSLAALYKACSRVLHRLQEEIRRLEQPEPQGGARP